MKKISNTLHNDESVTTIETTTLVLKFDNDKLFILFICLLTFVYLNNTRCMN